MIEDCMFLSEQLEQLQQQRGQSIVDYLWGQIGYGIYAVEHHLDRNRFSILQNIASRAEDPESLLKRLQELNNFIGTHVNDPHAHSYFLPFILPRAGNTIGYFLWMSWMAFFLP